MNKNEMINSSLNESSEKDNLINELFFNKYKLIKKIGKGSYGIIYLCKDIASNEFFAAKLQNKNIYTNSLQNEYQIMKDINIDKIPNAKFYGENNLYNILIMQLLGKSLEDIFEKILYKQKMPIHSVCNIAIQIIDILEQIHNKNYIHRDIKPSNFLFGNNSFNNNIIYLIDFGLAKKYRESNNAEHYEIKEENKLIGTARFASINAMEGLSQSRRDDLESLGYMLIYFLKGKLPWQNFLIKNKEERYNKIKQTKKEIVINELCSDCPEEIGQYITYVKKLKYEEEPNYNYIKNLFYEILNKTGNKFDYLYDWDNTKTIIDVNLESDFIDEENNLNLPLDKIICRKKYRKKRNKSQDKSTNIEREENENENNDDSEQIIFQNNNGCCIIV